MKGWALFGLLEFGALESISHAFLNVILIIYHIIPFHEPSLSITVSGPNGPFREEKGNPKS